jgi:hypothetical protein
MNYIFLYIGSLIILGWGIAHLFPTVKVVQGFGDISPDNRHIITMEWIIEGALLIFLGSLILIITYIDPYDPISRTVYRLSFIFLNVLTLISLFTGYKHSFIMFKLCPYIFTGSSILILIGGLIA